MGAPLAALAALHRTNARQPVVVANRGLWARLLETTLGAQLGDDDDDELFIAHTLVVSVAKLAAHALVELAPETLDPRTILSGERLASIGVYGVVEADVFGWVAEVEGGDSFIRDLAHEVSELDWAAVQHDVLKALYESVIAAPIRKRLGEHYTPDWLAEIVTTTALPDPLESRVLDPACGSGTFVFHAARRCLAAADSAGHGVGKAIEELTRSVVGMDLHPVAVSLARVTYLLAIGRERLLSPARGRIRVPIYLADAMRWPSKIHDGIAAPAEQFDLLLGNPPWLAYRYMQPELQADFRRLSEAYRIWHGATVATHQDLSGLFALRTIESHLRDEGRFAFIMPSAALDRQHFRGFRSGHHDGPEGQLRVAFGEPWDLRKLRPHFFPITACVVFGRRSAEANPLPDAGEIWSGRVPEHASWASVGDRIERRRGTTRAAVETERSPYHPRFRQGATIVPRVLFFVERAGDAPDVNDVDDVHHVSIRSVRSNYEKRPWKDLSPLAGVVEAELVYRVHLGETVLPYRVREPRLCVLPLDRAGNWQTERIQAWWLRTRELWAAHRTNDRLSLEQQLDYHGKLTGQFPIPPKRIVYSASGMHLAAARVLDERAVIEHGLYWASVESDAEAHFLCAILNAASVTQLVRPLMAFGKDERHIDKYVWSLPIPRFDPTNVEHVQLAALGAEAESTIAEIDIEDTNFIIARKRIREFLQTSELGRRIDLVTTTLLEQRS